MLDVLVSIAKIRYNTLSDGTHLCWRLLIEGQEHLVNEVDIQAPCITSKDWLEDKKEFKHHITVNNCRVIINEDSSARILPVTVTE